MRELKFRFWCPYTGSMKPAQTLYELHMAARFIASQCFDHAMQYTGHKDNNGVEIYEGDCIYDNIGHGVVEYVEEYAAFRVNYRDDSYCKWFYDYLDSEKATLEVIGNVHENPELLEKI